jgi:hypothetical protein
MSDETSLERLQDENTRLRAALETALELLETSTGGEGAFFETRTVVALLREALRGDGGG